MQKVILKSLIAVCLGTTAFAADTAAPAISARSPEIVATYQQSDKFVASLSTLEPKLQRMCKSLLDSQIKLLVTSDSWKMYSLYEMFNEQRLMTSDLQRVGTITELAGAIPKYTKYRQEKENLKNISNLKNGSIMIADKGPQCGPDPLSTIKGAYFLKCGNYLIGSGLIPTNKLELKNCQNIRVLTQTQQ